MQLDGTPGPQKPEYEPKDIMGALGYLVEECGEVGQAIGKILRYGMDSYNPDEDVHPRDRTTNAKMLRMEMLDLEAAIFRVRKFMDTEGW